MASRLIARDIETRAVEELLTRVGDGPSAMIVDGEAGIGKTTLVLGAVDRAAEAGFQVLVARGSQSEAGYAYSALGDLLGGADPAVHEMLPHTARSALERAASGITAVGAPAIDERMAANAFQMLIQQLAGRAPVLVVIDDAQWLDASSRAVIGYAARRLTGQVGMLLSIRTGDPASNDGLSWLDLPRPEMVTRMSMRPLNLGGVHALIADRVGHTFPRPEIVRICEVSGGNPLFAIELAAHAIAEGRAAPAGLPETLAELVRRRIGEVPTDTGGLLLTIASASRPTVEMLSLATGHSTDRVVELLEPVEHLGIIEIDGNAVHFTHPLFAGGVHSDATAAQRRAVHARLAVLVERPEEKARHLALAATTGDEATLAAIDAAVETTSAQGALAVAAELIELALKFDPQNLPRRIRAGELHLRAGAIKTGRRHLEAARRDAPPGVPRSMALMWLAAAMGYDDDVAGAVEALAEAVEEAGDNDALRLLALLRLCLALAMTDRLSEAIPLAQTAVELADQLGIADLRSQARSFSVIANFIYGRGVDHSALRTALDLEVPNGGATTFFRASAVLPRISAWIGDLDAARHQIRTLQKQVIDGGTEVEIIWAAVHVASIAILSGRYVEATQAAHDAAQRAEQLAGRLNVCTTQNQLAAAAAYTGREDDARTAATAAIEAGHRIGATHLTKEPTAYLAFLEVSLGNYSAALKTLRPLLDGFHPLHGVEIEGGRYLPDAIEALAALGRSDEAQPLADALTEAGAVRDRPWMLAMGARGQAHILSAQGDLEAAEHAAETALIHHQRLPMPFETARTQLLLGQIQRRRRHRQAAQMTLAAALATFESLGTPLWAQRTRAELNRVEPGATGGELTPAEERVARRAAAGLSNKEIAAELFLAPKTVEMNLSSVYRKLGIRSRSQLHSRLGDSPDSRENPATHRSP